MAPSFALLGILFQIVVGVSGGIQAPELKPPASTTAEKDKCTLAGTVSSMQTGEPVKKATLHLTLRNTSRAKNGVFEQTGYSGTSGPDGSFKFEGVEPGEYSLSGEKSSFIRTSYGSKSGMTGGTTLTLSPGQQMADVKFALVAQATITGRVLDEDGDPMGGVSVQVIGRMWMQGGKARYIPRGQATTDDQGAYRVAKLVPGKYYVTAQNGRQQMMGANEQPATPGKPNLQPVRTFYPSSLDRTGASMVELKAGQEVPGVEIRMRAVETFHIRGKFVGEMSDGQPTMLMLMPQNDDGLGSFTFNGFTNVGKDHTFGMNNVTPGAYVIGLANMGGGKQTARQSVEVNSSDVNDVVVTTQPTFTIHGQVELQGKLSGDTKDQTLDGIYVTLQPEDSGMMFGNAQTTTKADGTFVMEDVMPGKVRPTVFNVPDGAYVKSIRSGNQETLGKTLDLTQAAGADLHVTLHAGAAQVTGTVTAKKGDSVVPVSSASVILIPEDMTRNGGNVHSAGTNQNGAFTEKGLTPGAYYALAYELEERRDLQDPTLLKLLADKGIKVELKENDKQQVSLTLLPAEDLEAALTAAGVDN